MGGSPGGAMGTGKMGGAGGMGGGGPGMSPAAFTAGPPGGSMGGPGMGPGSGGGMPGANAGSQGMKQAGMPGGSSGMGPLGAGKGPGPDISGMGGGLPGRQSITQGMGRMSGPQMASAAASGQSGPATGGTTASPMQKLAQSRAQGTMPGQGVSQPMGSRLPGNIGMGSSPLPKLGAGMGGAPGRPTPPGQRPGAAPGQPLPQSAGLPQRGPQMASSAPGASPASQFMSPRSMSQPPGMPAGPTAPSRPGAQSTPMGLSPMGPGGSGVGGMGIPSALGGPNQAPQPGFRGQQMPGTNLKELSPGSFKSEQGESGVGGAGRGIASDAPQSMGAEARNRHSGARSQRGGSGSRFPASSAGIGRPVDLSTAQKAGVYGQGPGYRDPMDKGVKGVSEKEQGIALPDPKTKGESFEVTDPITGRKSTERQTDVGPHAKTGRNLDIHAEAARRLGFPDEKSFPTNREFMVKPVPGGSPAGPPMQAAKSPFAAPMSYSPGAGAAPQQRIGGLVGARPQGAPPGAAMPPRGGMPPQGSPAGLPTPGGSPSRPPVPNQGGGAIPSRGGSPPGGEAAPMGGAPRPPGAPPAAAQQRGPLPYQTAAQRFQPAPGQSPIPGKGTYSPPVGPPPRPPGAPGMDAMKGGAPGGAGMPQGSMPPPGNQSLPAGALQKPQGPPGSTPQSPLSRQQLDQQWASRPQFDYGRPQPGAGAPNAAPPPQAAPQAPMPQQRPPQAAGPPNAGAAPMGGAPQPTPQPGAPPTGSPAGLPQQAGQQVSAAELMQSAPKGAGHEQKLQHLIKNAHRLDPQSRQQVQQIQRAYQRERHGLGAEPARGYPETLRNADTYRGEYIGPQSGARAGDNHSPSVGSSAPAPHPVGRTSQGQPVSVGMQAHNPQTGEVVQFTGKGWEPMKRQQAANQGQSMSGRGGRQGKGKQQNPFAAAAKAIKPSAIGGKGAKLHVTPMRPIKRFHAKRRGTG